MFSKGSLIDHTDSPTFELTCFYDFGTTFIRFRSAFYIFPYDKIRETVWTKNRRLSICKLA